jgi:hypothetical protein
VASRVVAIYSALVTRPGRSSRGLAALFRANPSAAVLRVLREAGTGLTAAEIKLVLGKAGVPQLDKTAWGRLQKRLRADSSVMVEAGYRYRWIADSPDALEDVSARQNTLDGLRSLAALASEVEELTINQASSRAMIHRVRSRVRLSGLEPIERAGDRVAFDRRRHEPIGAPIADGTSVVVVRPGYMWKSAHEDVLVVRAAVQE